MFGLDDWLASFSDGTSAVLVILVAVLLGLRHATDPDHVAAVSTLVAGARDRAARRAAELGLAWGAGHAAALFAFGLPILLLDSYLPERVQQGAETAIAAVIVFLAARLLLRWRQGAYHVHEHEHDGRRHVHVHSHQSERRHAHIHRGRTRAGAFGIGLAHGVGGSAGVGVLIVASVESTGLAVLALGLLALFTAVSMCALSTGFGLALVSRPVRRAWGGVAPALGLASLAFGVWYASAAWGLAAYPF
jgi:ABC-type nickel/cobalt efflux system permease component RcnA